MRWMTLVLIAPMTMLQACDQGSGETDTNVDTGPEDTTSDVVAETAPDLIADTVDDPESEPPGGLVGDACVDDIDCMGIPSDLRVCMYGAVSPDHGDLVGGYCSADCTNDAECGDGAFCSDYRDNGNCFKVCSVDSDCRTAEGYSCLEYAPIGPDRYCLPLP